MKIKLTHPCVLEAGKHGRAGGIYEVTKAAATNIIAAGKGREAKEGDKHEPAVDKVETRDPKVETRDPKGKDPKGDEK